MGGARASWMPGGHAPREPEPHTPTHQVIRSEYVAMVRKFAVP